MLNLNVESTKKKILSNGLDRSKKNKSAWGIPCQSSLSRKANGSDLNGAEMALSILEVGLAVTMKG